MPGRTHPPRVSTHGPCIQLRCVSLLVAISPFALQLFPLSKSVLELSYSKYVPTRRQNRTALLRFPCIWRLWWADSEGAWESVSLAGLAFLAWVLELLTALYPIDSESAIFAAFGEAGILKYLVTSSMVWSDRLMVNQSSKVPLPHPSSLSRASRFISVGLCPLHPVVLLSL
ncbi:hypothetical protein K503DRAFT_555517 [Rhizopogon vinicolor AM-OR11-026]|uniref:Uncharacterized protein n=1 Tax=Rhizopogon vinicolor AM-OR11-026 TaxID=1314800 RepID=A0A1B7N860_9AGAM|nr:hypothetical protein K503DRAFT_555517 [Rhizopogon vinicolor AM-OR11-026]